MSVGTMEAKLHKTKSPTTTKSVEEHRRASSSSSTDRRRQDDNKQALMRAMVYQNHCLEIQVAESQRELVKCRQLLAAHQAPTSFTNEKEDDNGGDATGGMGLGKGALRRPSLISGPQASYQKLV
ncbi:hypothetical protein DYB38_006265 [Aphanomyces astaci]|nr:hypothetical protein DYB38_006265 [Aphanomyces astaci]RHZ12829.1 hypothetical protein DYB31_008604 [Aphanomyces astaci]